MSQYSDIIPQDILLRIKRHTLRDIAHQMKLQKATTDILKLLHQHNVNVLPIKGMALSQHIYADLRLRSGNDIDLLVLPDDFHTAETTLLNHGFSLKIPDPALSDAKKHYLYQRSHSFVYMSDQLPFEIDLHWRLTEMPALNASFLFDGCDSRTFDLGEVQVPSIDLHRYLIYLTLHGAIDQWRHLKSLVDIANIFRLHSDLDIDQLLQLAREHDCQRPLRQALTLCESWLGLKIPKALNDSLPSRHNGTLVRLAENRLFRPRPIRSLMERARFQLTVLHNFLLIKPGIRHKWQALGWFFSPSEQHLPRWLPDSLIPLAFLLRPLTAFFRPFR